MFAGFRTHLSRVDSRTGTLEIRALGVEHSPGPAPPVRDALHPRMAERRTIVVAGRCTRAERADWPAKAEAGP